MVLAAESHRTGYGSPFRRYACGGSLLLCLLVSVASGQYGGGSGMPEDPFLIYTAEQFSAIGDRPNDWDKDFKLMNDIDLSEYSEANLHMIGDYVALGVPDNRPYSGIFNGNGKTISNFHYRDTEANYVGLFQHVVGEVENLHLRNATVTGDQFGAGTLVGYLEKGGVTRCSVTGADVSGDGRVGGLIGYADGHVALCWSQGRIAGVRFVGGLVGQIGQGSVARSYSKAAVTGGEFVGGLIGGMTRDTAILDSSYAQGDVSGTFYVGGLIGEVSQGRVYKCYSASAVSGDSYVGGLVGNTRGNANLTQVLASVWDVDASGQTTSAAGTGCTTQEMKSFDPYDSRSWDFVQTWALCDGLGYPVLMWQIPVGDLACPDGVTFSDFVWFAQNWRHSDCVALNWNCEGADFDESGDVDSLDLATFAANWLAGIE